VTLGGGGRKQIAGMRVVLVSSGAVSVGCQRLGLVERPKDIITKQAVAAVGQGRLIAMYDNLFSALGQPIAQVLLTRENLSSESHYFNALNTFQKLLDLGIIPIVNENDTVSGEP
jgi:glutamate 5-kinase